MRTGGLGTAGANRRKLVSPDGSIGADPTPEQVGPLAGCSTHTSGAYYIVTPPVNGGSIFTTGCSNQW